MTEQSRESTGSRFYVEDEQKDAKKEKRKQYKRVVVVVVVVVVFVVSQQRWSCCLTTLCECVCMSPLPIGALLQSEDKQRRFVSFVAKRSQRLSIRDSYKPLPLRDIPALLSLYSSKESNSSTCRGRGRMVLLLILFSCFLFASNRSLAITFIYA